LPGGQYLFPSAQITNKTTADSLGYDAVVQGPNAQSSVNQGIANVDYNVNDMDRLTVKYYYQNNPTTNPFGAVGALLGFPQQLQAGSQVAAVNNTVILSPSLTWQQHAGFTRLQAYSQTQQEFSPSTFGMSLLGATSFPQVEISDALSSNTLEFGPSVSFGNAGMYQNQWELGSSLNWVKGRHTISIGGTWAHTQLNIINNNTESDTLDFKSFTNFVEGAVRTGSYSVAFPDANASRYYRSDTAGVYVNDNYKVASNLSLTLGLRWDFDGPLSEEYGRLATFNPSLYAYNASSDTITNSGLEVAANNSSFGTAGANDTLTNRHQWGLAPRIGWPGLLSPS
jgi:outer membrane receptor for ferrienterochelin and colicin